MIKNIVVFTSSYPYGSGETYLEAELEYLAELGVRTIIAPLYRPFLNEPHRILPDECELLNFRPTKKKKIYRIAETICSGAFWHGLCELFLQNKVNRKTIWELMKFVHSGIAHSENLTVLLDSTDILPIETCLYSYWMDSVALSIVLLKKKFKYAKAICRAHGGDLYDERLTWGHQFLRQYLVKNLNYVFPVSIQGKKYFDQRIGVYDNVIPMHLGIKDNGSTTACAGPVFQIVSCSNAIPLKRIDFLIDVLSKLRVGFFWRHFGEGIQLDELKKVAKEKLNAANYRFEGNIGNSQLMEYYKNNRIDLFINLSETEGVPVSIMEALSFGIPVIATNVGGVSELIIDGYNGRLIPPHNNSKMVAETIEKYIKLDEVEIARYRQNARESYLKEWMWRTNYSAFYEKIL